MHNVQSLAIPLRLSYEMPRMIERFSNLLSRLWRFSKNNNPITLCDDINHRNDPL